MCIYIYNNIYTHTHIYTYIYIYIERERETYTQIIYVCLERHDPPLQQRDELVEDSLVDEAVVVRLVALYNTIYCIVTS